MAGVHDEAERLQIESLEQWREWLEANHEQPDGVWLVTFKKASPGPSVDYVALVEEALSFGWIDGTARTVDDERSMIWLAPRRKGSVWAASNRERVARLEREGRMRPAGRAVVERAQADGSWSVLIPAERGEVPDDLAEAFAASPGRARRGTGSRRRCGSRRCRRSTWRSGPRHGRGGWPFVAARTAAGERPV